MLDNNTGNSSRCAAIDEITPKKSEGRQGKRGHQITVSETAKRPRPPRTGPSDSSAIGAYSDTQMTCAMLWQTRARSDGSSLLSSSPWWKSQPGVTRFHSIVTPQEDMWSSHYQTPRVPLCRRARQQAYFKRRRSNWRVRNRPGFLRFIAMARGYTATQCSSHHRRLCHRCEHRLSSVSIDDTGARRTS
ncbi:hypothetical protein MRX96_029765 [Rhipicephalus microplus]